MKNKELYICRICGFEDNEPFWLPTGGPAFQICLCCGCESGYHDCQLSAIKENRKKWLNSEKTWFDESKKPKHWDLLEQIKNIPKKFI